MKFDFTYSHHKSIEHNDVFSVCVWVGFHCIAEVSREFDNFEVAFHSKFSEHICDINDFEQAANILKEQLCADDEVFYLRVHRLAKICCCVYGNDNTFFLSEEDGLYSVFGDDGRDLLTRVPRYLAFASAIAWALGREPSDAVVPIAAEDYLEKSSIDAHEFLKNF